jgi:hypothetical protein
MSDYSVIQTYVDSQSLNYFTLYAKSEKPIKAVIRHLPADTPAKDISNGLDDLGYDVLSVKQMTTTRSSEDERMQVIHSSLHHAYAQHQITRNIQAEQLVPHSH